MSKLPSYARLEAMPSCDSRAILCAHEIELEKVREAIDAYPDQRGAGRTRTNVRRGLARVSDFRERLGV